jgi:serine/threonine protein phosphatase 1
MYKEIDVPHPIKRLAENKQGRDFIVADLHGCRHLLEDRLAQVQFDPEVDRVLSVGDIVDRGPLSFETLRLIEEPWFEFVIGNHEAMLLTYLRHRASSYHSPRDFLNNGGIWIADLSREQEQYLEHVLLPILAKAPLVLSVEDSDCPFHVLHAEAQGRGTRGLLSNADLQSEETVNFSEVSLTWGRRLVQGAAPALNRAALPGQLVLAEPAIEPGLALTYVGHTILPHPVLHRSHLFMDCGAFRAVEGQGYLMLVEHKDVVKHLRLAGVAI